MPVMRLPVRATTLATLLVVLVPAAARAADVPSRRTLYADGPAGRYLVDGTWLFRLDNEDQGIRQRFMRQSSTAGWKPVTVPNAWNVGDPSNESMKGGIGWYRKDFRLPSAPASASWIVRFESVNYRARVWLNGRPIGGHTGSYLPFELPLSGVRRTGTNRLVVRVDSHRHRNDLPPLSTSVFGVPGGGWWNWSGLLREVYLRRVDGLDWSSVRVRPRLPCRRCAATVSIRATVRNAGGGAQSVRVGGRLGTIRFSAGAHAIRRHGFATFSKTVRVGRPRLWSPDHPTLYPVTLTATGSGGARARYSLHTGIRSIKKVGDRLYLNGAPINPRGFGYHEDEEGKGGADDNAFRLWLMTEVKAAGGTIIRTHYPPHPYLLELADRMGILVWHEVPVYSIKTETFASADFRRRATDLVRAGVEENGNHVSIIVWSIANEPSTDPGPVQIDYIHRAAAAVRALDDRPVAYALPGYPFVPCHRAQYADLDVLGFNDYFGWYPGPGGQIFDRAKLSPYLDALHACYPDKAIVISEFGAEANRDGPAEEKGTWAFQQDFVNYHLGVFASKPWLNGAIYWALNEFWVRPGWEGGNPRPSPPLHEKGLVTYDRKRKPAWFDVQRIYRQTQQYPPPG